MTRWLAAAIILGIVTSAAPTLGQNFGEDPTERFSVSWNAITTRHGRPAIEGYIVNATALAYQGIELAIEIRDANGRPLKTALVNLDDHLRPHDRLYFRSTLPTAGASYNVRVQSYVIIQGGPGARNVPDRTPSRPWLVRVPSSGSPAALSRPSGPRRA